MRNNPLQKVEYLVNRRVYGNPATLRFNISSREIAGGAAFRDVKVFSRPIYVKDPHTVSERLVDTQGTFSKETPNYLKGDITVEIAAKEVTDAIAATSSSDPVVVVNGVTKTLPQLRDANDAITCGIKQDVDSLVLNGQEWRFVGINPLSYFAGVPASLKCQMRRM